MGLVKRMLEELQDGTCVEVFWECFECSKRNNDYIDVPQINYSSDHASDYSASESINLTCTSCGEEFGGEIWNNCNYLECFLRDKNGEDFEVFIDDENFKPMFEESDYWEPSDCPYDEFQVCLEGMRNLLENKSPSEHDHQLLNRVVFCQLITGLEAYLSDTLINFIDKNVAAQSKLYNTDKCMKVVSFKATNIVENPNLPKLHLLSYLKNLSFHNFPEIDKIYQNACNISIFVEKDDREFMNKARILRHDCVHRNGKTSDGEKHDIFDKEYVLKISNIANKMVNHINILMTVVDKPPIPH